MRDPLAWQTKETSLFLLFFHLFLDKIFPFHYNYKIHKEKQRRESTIFFGSREAEPRLKAPPAGEKWERHSELRHGNKVPWGAARRYGDKWATTNQGGTAGNARPWHENFRVSFYFLEIMNPAGARDWAERQGGIMDQKFFAPKGTNDILPEEIPVWEKIEKTVKETATKFGFRQIRTPEFEVTPLFERGVGDTTDIVQKEMYTFSRGKESFTLKPEGTAPVVRSFIENGMGSAPQPVKLFYLTNCFRGENPQKGRYRQFHQFGAEALGSASPMMDAEIISLADSFIRSMGIKNISLQINSVGCPTCRRAYYEKLRAFLADKLSDLCEDCRGRYEKNPMRIIDCKKEHCQQQLAGVPMMLDNLCDDCREHFEGVKTYLTAAGVAYEVNPRIVRGLDYYTNTAFEFLTSDIGAQAALCAGGRYNGLAETLGGAPTPGIGFALGIERLILVLQAQGIQITQKEDTDCYIAPLGEEARKRAMGIAAQLRDAGFTVQTDMMERSLKAQMKFADKIDAKCVVMLGEEELSKNIGLIRDMNTKEQREIPLDRLVETMVQRGKREETK